MRIGPQLARLVCLVALGPSVARGAPLPEGSATRLRAEPRRPMPLVVLSPTGARGRVRLADVRAAFAAPIEELTAFEPVAVVGDAVRDCAARVSCIVRGVRPDYDRDDLRRTDGQLEPYAVHRARVEAAELRPPRFVVVVTHVTIPDRPDRVVALLVDTDAALRSMHELEPDPAQRERVEELVLRRAVRAELELDAAQAPEDVERFARVFFRSRVAPILDAEGAWRPFGQVTLRDVPPGSEIALDGAPLGVAASRVVIVADLRPGLHEIAVRHPEHEPLETSVRAEATSDARIDVRMRPRARGPLTPRGAVVVGGVAAMLAGSAVLIAAAAQDTDATTFCFEGPGCAAGGRFDAVGGPPEPGVGSAASGGVLMAPLGFSLVAAGATWTVGAGFVEREGVPWISTLAGLALGGLTYGVAAAASQ